MAIMFHSGIAVGNELHVSASGTTKLDRSEPNIGQFAFLRCRWRELGAAPHNARRTANSLVSFCLRAAGSLWLSTLVKNREFIRVNFVQLGIASTRTEGPREFPREAS